MDISGDGLRDFGFEVETGMVTEEAGLDVDDAFDNGCGEKGRGL